ncbi:ROK family transcriptional regulator [Streptomyces sp. HNM0575]|uniref:ROK family transcriptional regulator n=1 Tax=Streptomyces sp. HNM0575 TaxID=2716338 RepID=UPI00145E3D19|nr:ROK family transcriptional regulator [Streptomyces sp. HNM0575]NLU71916.1 ROK family transcriptional regulator [Streptomyces sp. HNM0575]
MPSTSRDVADTAYVRRLNAQRVLTALRAGSAMSASELISATGMSRPTVHAAARHLIDLGWVAEAAADHGTSAPRRGRPSRVFAFRADAGHVLGIDVGAHTARAVLADLRGESVAERQITFDDPDVEARRRIALVRDLAAGTVHDAGFGPGHVLSVCVGTSGTISEAGVVRVRTGIPGFLDVDLRTAMAEGFGWHVTVENDCNLAAVAERWRGTAAGTEDFLCLLAGERLGVGVFTGGTLLRGHHNKARDLSFLKLMPGATLDGIGLLARRRGAELVAGPARRRTARTPRAAAAVLHDLVDGDPERVDAEAVFRAVREGDKAAAGILDQALDSTARAVATLSMILAPELVVVSGAVAAAGDVLLEPLRRAVGRIVDDVPRLAASPLTHRAVVTGALHHALQHTEGRYLDALAEAPSGVRP